ncbi:MAG: SLC13 family permease, partial [Anaerolineae bacterium]
DFHLAEITLAPNSNLENQTVQQIDLRGQYNLSVLALRHNGVEQIDQLGKAPISFGDSLLVYGPDDRLNKLINDPNLLVLETPKIELRRLSKAPYASLILLAVLITAALGLLHVAALMLAGALLMVILGVLKMDEAYRSIDWKAVFLIAGMLPLGIAMEKTGTAQLIADQLINVTGGLGPVAVLCAMFVLTALLTEVISNAAAAVLVIPIAIDVAFGLNLDPRPFVMATVIAASTSFLMPIGHQVNIIIYGAGGYRFSDYARVGVWLNLILLAVVAIFVPIIWPF